LKGPGGWKGPHDLVALVADGTMRRAMEGLLLRHGSLGIRPLEARVFTGNPPYDSEAFLRCQDYLRPFLSLARYALVSFDREGCGSTASRAEIETEVERRLAQNGWEKRAVVVVIDPELEAWVWSDSPEVDVALGWSERGVGLRAWLAEGGFWQSGHDKPARPKEALEATLRNSNKRRSSSLYVKLATKVSPNSSISH
jgi:hypothetical protein